MAIKHIITLGLGEDGVHFITTLGLSGIVTPTPDEFFVVRGNELVYEALYGASDEFYIARNEPTDQLCFAMQGASTETYRLFGADEDYSIMEN